MNKYLLLLFLFVNITTYSLAEQSRYALVIGNATYPDARLSNPINDADDMTAKLKQRGFTVTRLVNASQESMEKAIQSFTDKLTNTGTVGVFYYAGHGLEVEGENYLVPVDADLPDESAVKYKTVNMGQVLDRMQRAGNGLNLVILDACRNNPFKRSWRRGLSRVTGLAQMQPAAGTLILYATEPHKEAEDGKGRNGTFTKHLLTALDNPGMQVEEVFKQVSEQVTDETNKQQIPWFEGVIHGRFYFVPPLDTSELPQTSTEQIYWQSTEKCGTVKCFKAYLKKYPHGEFVELAKAQLSESIPAPVKKLDRELISSRYQDNGDGTVTDITTKLMWKRCAEGQTLTGSNCHGESSGIAWDAVMPNEQQKDWDTFAGYSDWQVPTIEQLRSLVYCSSNEPKIWNDTGNSCEGDYQSPTIDTTAFPDTGELSGFWSSSAAALDFGVAWGLSFFSGNDGLADRSLGLRVRLVRGAR